MLFAECDCRVGLVCNNGGLTAKLMYPEAYRLCHCLAERLSRCIRITPGIFAKPQRLVRETEETKCQAIVRPYMNSRVLRGQIKIRRGFAVVAQADAAFELRMGRGKFPLCK